MCRQLRCRSDTRTFNNIFSPSLALLELGTDGEASDGRCETGEEDRPRVIGALLGGHFKATIGLLGFVRRAFHGTKVSSFTCWRSEVRRANISTISVFNASSSGVERARHVSLGDEGAYPIVVDLEVVLIEELEGAIVGENREEVGVGHARGSDAEEALVLLGRWIVAHGDGVELASVSARRSHVLVDAIEISGTTSLLGPLAGLGRGHAARSISTGRGFVGRRGVIDRGKLANPVSARPSRGTGT